MRDNGRFKKTTKSTKYSYCEILKTNFKINIMQIMLKKNKNNKMGCSTQCRAPDMT